MNFMETKRIDVCVEFYDMVQKFIDDFNKSQGIELSIPKATKIIYTKIKKLGGLVV